MGIVIYLYLYFLARYSSIQYLYVFSLTLLTYNWTLVLFQLCVWEASHFSESNRKQGTFWRKILA